MGVLGGLAARGEHHDRVWSILGVEHPAATWEPRDWYPGRAAGDRARFARGGRVVWAVGNTPLETEEQLRPHVDFVGSVGPLGRLEAGAGVLRAADRGGGRRA